MNRKLIKVITAGLVLPVLLMGCILTRGVDRKFLGATVTKPEHHNRKILGITILPIAFALDVVTLPIQAILLMIFGDDFPYEDRSLLSQAELGNDPQFRRLSAEAQARSLVELREMVRSGKVSGSTALALCDDGRWVPVHLSAQDQSKLYARASGASGLMTAQTTASR